VLNKSSFYVLERSWSTDGAQEFPFGAVVVERGESSYLRMIERRVVHGEIYW
jgi:hypothetical protein